ncbi:MAG: hypothetical protein U1F56_02525 [Rubrivivax sp.]
MSRPAPPAPGRRRPGSPWAWAAGATGLLLAATLGLAWALTSAEPAVARRAALEVADVERALRLARQHDPRRALPGVLRGLRLTQHECEVLLDQAAARTVGGHWRVELGTEQLVVRGSVPLPAAPLPRWVDVVAVAEASQGLPQLRSVRLGPLPLPTTLVERFILHWADRHDLAGAEPVLQVQRVTLRRGSVEALYAWGPGAPARLAAVLLPARDHARLQLYAARLAAQAGDGSPRSLAQVLPPLFELARERSAQGHEAALENRAALLVLGLVANGIGLDTLLPQPRGGQPARPIRLTLAGRSDFPQHLLMSAALAADSGSGLADRLGLYKELADARGGSGFSFNDMAANRAGTRLGELAVHDPLRLQGRLAGRLSEGDFMPDVSDLPEFLNERDFRSRFGAPGSPAYERLMSDIEQRLEATPLFRP